MHKGVLLGGLIGGIVMFLWGAISHMVLPIGDAGMRAMPDEARVLSAMQAAMPDPGLYYFPEPKGDSEADRARWQEQIANGPSGLLVYLPKGNAGMTPAQLVTELVADVLCALLAGFVLAKSRGVVRSYGGGVVLVGLLGFLPWLSISASNWTWYHFPTAYFLGEGVDQLVGFVLAGLVVSATVKAS